MFNKNTQKVEHIENGSSPESVALQLMNRIIKDTEERYEMSWKERRDCKDLHELKGLYLNLYKDCLNAVAGK